MPKKCTSCSYFSLENDPQSCPDCGANLQFTMFVPQGFPQDDASTTAPPAHETKPAWDVDSADYELMELPWLVRLGQIAAGVGAIHTTARYMRIALFLMLFSSENALPSAFTIVVAAIATVLIHCVSAIAGGAVAGAWSVSWIPQGIGVGLGALLIPLTLTLVFTPTWAPIMAQIGLILITTLFAVLGAWIGHKIVRPSRFVLS